MHFLKKIFGRLENLTTGYQKLQKLEYIALEDRKSVKINIGKLQAGFNATKKNIASLSEVEFQVFSQFGDDGIIQWLLGFLPVPNKTFIEFGVENYRESNTRFLLLNNYWSGFIIDGSEENMAEVKRERIYSFYDLKATTAFIDRENINGLIKQSGFENEAGLLSVDIDGNDYWVWKEINIIKPVIVICEYNALFGFEHPFTIDYKKDFIRGGQLPFGFFGVSLLSLIDLGEEKGYSFIGCNSAGNNAYFIRDDYMKHLPIGKCSARDGFQFSSYTETYSEEKNDLARSGDKLLPLQGLPVFNTRTEKPENIDAPGIIQSLHSANKIRRKP